MYYDVIVIGGGHAACEAAYAAARCGAKTLMLVINLDHIAQMSCNPCIGGIAKGHLVREIDALGGAMGKVADASAIQFHMLNGTKGAAVRSPRAQCDKFCYQRAMKLFLEGVENLSVHQALATSFLIKNGAIAGVNTEFGETFHAKAVVMAAGTFLRGKLHYGLKDFPGGRAGDPPSVELSDAIREQLGLRMGRLKTGTPPRIYGRSIDFTQLTPQGADEPEERFTFYPETEIVLPRVAARNMTCYMTHTTEETAELVRANLDRAPMYNGKIEGTGTRYCPSFEDKVMRFPDHERHHIYLEPEGEFTDEYYLNGLSTSLPTDVQRQLVQSVPGLRNAVIARYAYAIEYDFIYPEELNRCLAVKKWPGLYHAGQVNGTSGYEEAAAQGLAAGLNAARYAAGKDGIEFSRDESYLGVMIDDLVTKEIVEPYRLFTSRAEYRLRLRQDNADLRLCDLAHSAGLVSDTVYNRFCEYRNTLDRAEELCKAYSLSGGHTAWTVIRDMRGEPDMEKLPAPPETFGFRSDTREGRRIFRQLAIRAHYEGYIRQEDQSVARLRHLESWRIPADFDYDSVTGLRNESRMKLKRVAPASLSQASRIDGVTPVEISLLQVWLERLRHKPEEKVTHS